MTVKMGALEVVFDVFVLFHAGSGSPLHALMSWYGVWSWPSNLLWCSGPGVHPSILRLSCSQIHSLQTQSTSQAQADAQSFTSPAGDARPHSPAASYWWWNEEECASLFCQMSLARKSYAQGIARYWCLTQSLHLKAGTWSKSQVNHPDDCGLCSVWELCALCFAFTRFIMLSLLRGLGTKNYLARFKQ